MISSTQQSLLGALVAVLATACGAEPRALPDAGPRTDAPSGGGDAPQVSPITAPPPSLGVSTFYTKYLDADGIPIVASAVVADAAVIEAQRELRKLGAQRPELRTKLRDAKHYVIIMGKSQVFTDLPEYVNLYQLYPDFDWNKLAREMSANSALPFTSVAEENIMCDPSDPWAGESLMVYAFAQTWHTMGFGDVGPAGSFDARLTAAFDAAKTSGHFTNTWAISSKYAYFAEGAQDWFDANREANPPNGVHGTINTRAELIAADPGLSALLMEALPSDDWRLRCSDIGR